MATEQIEIAHYDLRFFKPLDKKLLHEVFQKGIITIEDGHISDSVGSVIMEFMIEHRYSSTLRRLGLPDAFAVQSAQDQIHEMYVYDKNSMIT